VRAGHVGQEPREKTQQRRVEGERQSGCHAPELVRDSSDIVDVEVRGEELGEAADGEADAQHRSDEAEDGHRPDEEFDRAVMPCGRVGLEVRLVSEELVCPAGVTAALQVVQEPEKPLGDGAVRAFEGEDPPLDVGGRLVDHEAREPSDLPSPKVPFVLQRVEVLEEQLHHGPRQQEDDQRRNEGHHPSAGRTNQSVEVAPGINGQADDELEHETRHHGAQ
jgi:hypothetical protein